MKAATETPAEHKRCRDAFEKREQQYYGLDLTKRRKKILEPGEGLYIDESVNMRWMTWQACWDYLRS